MHEERSRWIEAELDRRWEALRERHGISSDADPYEARTKLLEERLRDVRRS